jgi:hypothetical protein
MRRIPAVAANHERVSTGMSELRSIADKFESPDGCIHWRDSRPEWLIRHGFLDLVAREFHASKMTFPPNASCASQLNATSLVVAAQPVRLPLVIRIATAAFDPDRYGSDSYSDSCRDQSR